MFIMKGKRRQKRNGRRKTKKGNRGSKMGEETLDESSLVTLLIFFSTGLNLRLP